MSYPTDIDSPERMLLNAEALIAAASVTVSKVLNHIDPTRQSPESPTAKAEPVDPQTLAALARRLIVERRVRDRLLNIPDLFGEPAWDMLLDLFVAHLSGKQVSTSSACISSTAPATTGLRYLKALEGKKLIKRVRHQSDGRVVYVCLTDEAVAQMTRLLSRYANDRVTPPRF
jgi:hypothetical protein